MVNIHFFSQKKKITEKKAQNGDILVIIFVTSPQGRAKITLVHETSESKSLFVFNNSIKLHFCKKKISAADRTLFEF